jgi:hypothetical protein
MSHDHRLAHHETPALKRFSFLCCLTTFLCLLIGSVAAFANAPLPAYNWDTASRRGYRIDTATITNIRLLKCKEKVVIDQQSKSARVIPFVWICETEVSAAGVTYSDGEIPPAKVKKEKIQNEAEVEK